MVGQPLQVARDEQQVDQQADPVRILLDRLLDALIGLNLDIVHLIVHEDDLVGRVHIQVDQGVQTHLEHGQHLFGHGGVIEDKRQGWTLGHDLQPFRDIDRFVADALQVVVDLDGGNEKPQVHGHRLIKRQQLQALLLDLHLHLVDFPIRIDDPLGDIGIPPLDGLDRHARPLFDQGAQGEHLFLNLFQFSAQMF